MTEDGRVIAAHWQPIGAVFAPMIAHYHYQQQCMPGLEI